MIEHPAQHIILVGGATGHQGGAVARHLLGKGFRVRALTRNPDQAAARALAALGAEIIKGDLSDRASLERALASTYGAYSVQNTWTAGVEGEIKQGKAFADAVAESGVRHLVYSSVGGAERKTGIPHFDSKWLIEEHIRSLHLPATVLRPVFFMNNWAGLKDAIIGGQLPQPLSPNTKLQQIAVDDIGAFAALAFTYPDEWMGRAVEIAGDELTMMQTAEIFGRVLGRDVKYVQMPWEAFEQRAGKEMTAMFRWFESNGYKADIEALRKVYPRISSLESFLRTENWAHRV